MDTLITVVIPTYRRPALLKKCLEAVAAQTLDKTRFEVIVVNDGPDPPTAALVDALKENQPNLRFHSLPGKKGPAAARNLGWKNGKGQLIAFTDDDCLPDSNWLKAAYNELRSEGRIVFSGRVIVPIDARPTDHELNTANLQTAEFITANCFCTREALEVAGGFDERFELAWREDSDLQFRFLQLGIPIIKVPEAIVVHPVRKAPWGFSLKEQKKGLYNALLYKKFPDLYRQKIQPAPPWNYYIMTLCLLISIICFIASIPVIAFPALLIWAVLLYRFISKRLAASSLSVSHVTEMIITSLAIPFLSIYWQLYGAVKYRVWFF